MKRIFTLIAVLAVTLTTQAAITIYVQADEAPYLWAWVGSTNLMTEAWPGHQLTDKKTVQGTEFWYYTFDESVTSVNILFNNGSGTQTADINGITTDRYFTYDGGGNYTDVTEDYGGVVPDAEVTSLALAGNHNEWGIDMFDVVEAGKTFTITVNLSDATIAEDFWQFKIRPNAADWVGYSQVTITDQPTWLGEAIADGNFQVDLDGMAAADRVFTLTATWGGGKKADANWTFSIMQGTTGIKAINNNRDNSDMIYDLSGRRVENPTKGIYIMNGKKFVVK